MVMCGVVRVVVMGGAVRVNVMGGVVRVVVMGGAVRVDMMDGVVRVVVMSGAVRVGGEFLCLPLRCPDARGGVGGGHMCEGVLGNRGGTLLSLTTGENNGRFRIIMEH